VKKPVMSNIAKCCVLASLAWFATSVTRTPTLSLDANNQDARGVPITPITDHHSGTGLLALGIPSLGDRIGCVLCRLSRESGADYTAVEHPSGGPSRIILMRHADKPNDPDDEDLSQAGFARAEHLVTYIPQTFGKPDDIMASAHSKHSNRPTETVTPLAASLGINVEHDFENDDFEDLVDEIFSEAEFHGKTIVICWHHGKLPAIAALLGAPAGSYPDPWPEDTYNLILDFHYDPNSGKQPSVTRVIEPF
jgi:phosphohistidine phosphatase SixA